MKLNLGHPDNGHEGIDLNVFYPFKSDSVYDICSLGKIAE